MVKPSRSPVNNVPAISFFICPGIKKSVPIQISLNRDGLFIIDDPLPTASREVSRGIALGVGSYLKNTKLEGNLKRLI